MIAMFSNASAFDQDLSSWNIARVEDFSDMFNGVTLSSNNYDALLRHLSYINSDFGVIFDGGNSQYTEEAQAARDSLTHGWYWRITDGGLAD